MSQAKIPNSVMAGGGYYNQHSRTQALALQPALLSLKTAASEVAIPQNGEEFHIADLGSAQGKNSLGPLRLALNILRERQQFPFPVVITHTDQVGNDFSALFTLLRDDPESYLRGLGEVYPYAIGGSFYDRLFCEKDLDLAWSSIAVHWLSRVPAKIEDHFWFSFAKGEELQAYQLQARQDWIRFLNCRAKELKAGGRMVIVAGASSDAGDSGGESLMNLGNQVLRGMVEEGVISKDEYLNFNVPTYHRTLAEFLEPLEGELCGRYQVVSRRFDQTPDAQCVQFEQDKDAGRFAENLTGFFRGFTQPLLVGAMEEKRPLAERQAIAEEFYSRFRRAVLQDPMAVQFHWYVVTLDLRRLTDENP